MRRIGESAKADLSWVQVHWGVGQDAYELRSGDEVLGTVRYNGLFTAGADAEAATGRWIFSPDGISRQRTLIYAEGSDRAVAIYSNSALRGQLRGVLRFNDRSEFSWLRRGTWAPIWEFATTRGETILSITEKIELGACVEIREKAHSLPELPLLVLLGWYLRQAGVEAEERQAKRDASRRRHSRR
ncbi:MAG: hypothetical protein ACR2PL_26770 [Dehalococcoidia bacterium]